jgi:hypothetical protein
MPSTSPTSLRASVRGQEEWRGGLRPVARPQESGGPSWGLLVTGLVIAGLGLMAWRYLGPDLRRYLKIRSM